MTLRVKFANSWIQKIVSKAANQPVDDQLFLNSEKLSSVNQRDVDGERLIDFSITQTITAITAVSANDDHTRVSHDDRYQVTVNATRHDWPIRVTIEVSLSPDGPIASRSETTAEGWIDAGPLVYPRKVKHLNHLAGPVPSGSPNTGHRPVNTPTLAHAFTSEAETLEITVNTDLPDSVFAPAFPTGSVIQDAQDGKNYEVTAAGTEQLYQPRPKGLRSAVLGYHLLWMAIASTWLLRRK